MGEGNLTINLKKLNKDAILPEKAHKGDAGVDLRSYIDTQLKPLQRALIPTGIAISIPSGYAGFVQPRSGLAINKGISIVNTPGLIDSKYRGEIKVILINLDHENVFEVKKGDKIAQLVIQKVASVEFKEVFELDDTKRGSNGFGSTGL
ncbi:MAG: dUTP diphosphatase [Actinomycetia bacterium]|nr:dUTP diphosphatase [Actinomycetes bacterium]